ncbi:hypothetical protein [Anaerocellum diazotrophicum]|uniref:Uncharacterized protein n=1 Tax=Caldicellulosiruptor diazotrophicus TaxID=2806205 RepID=A0ABM7NQP7_9FIRM|nr:hypothetical protein [Caldicellulosiruptor diazotrophicus]BCS82449.1 hypothetical protein CaldiYA01_24090 [Caldicellulosiruptor diazotrophicus]
MGFVSIEVKELVNILLKNINMPDIVTNVEIEKNEVTVKVKPAAFLPHMSLKFTVESDHNKLLILFDSTKSLIIYGFLLGRLKDEKVEGIKLLKDRLEIDFQKVLNFNVNGVVINRLEVKNDGRIEIHFSCA